MKKLEALVDSQDRLGLGRPSLSFYRDSVGKEIPGEMPLTGEFEYIKEPEYPFPLSRRSWFFPPKVLIVGFFNNWDHWKGEVAWDSIIGNNRWTAQIPVVPASAQELVRRFKERAPEARLFMIFEPQWSPGWGEDPWIVAELGGRWIRVCGWGGDRDAIQLESI